MKTVEADVKTVEAGGFWKNDDFIATIGSSSVEIGRVRNEGGRFACFFMQQNIWPMRYFSKYDTAIRYVESNLNREKKLFWIDGDYIMKIGKYKMTIGRVYKVGNECLSITILTNHGISESIKSAMETVENEFG